MIQVTPQMRILVAVEPVDFRKGIDGLARLSREALKTDPFSGALIVFRNRRGQSLKCLVYDGQGFWLCQKRLSEKRFRWWPREGREGVCRMEAHELQLLLWNGDPKRCGAAPAWRKLGKHIRMSLEPGRQVDDIECTGGTKERAAVFGEDSGL